jgi:hypothetical protein
LLVITEVSKELFASFFKVRVRVEIKRVITTFCIISDGNPDDLNLKFHNQEDLRSPILSLVRILTARSLSESVHFSFALSGTKANCVTHCSSVLIASTALARTDGAIARCTAARRPNNDRGRFLLTAIANRGA